MGHPGLKPVKNKAGLPLYVSVKDAMLDAIRAGHFTPGQRLPSTKELSETLSVSLVTTHRAMQELEARGVVDRVQGRGTFIKDQSDRSGRRVRLGLLLQPEASLADYYHGQLLEGMHHAAREEGADLLILQYEQKQRTDCQGFLLINPLPEAVDAFRREHPADTPMLVVGAHHPGVPAVDVDNISLIRTGLTHLHRMGHTRVSYVGGAGELSNSRDRQTSFTDTCRKLGLDPADCQRLDAKSWRLSDEEKMALGQLLTGPTRPTALIAGGYYLALDIYQVAGTLGLNIPDQLAVVGIDDPPSAAHLYPPLTTYRQPLAELGYAAIRRITTLTYGGTVDTDCQKLIGELIIRGSSGAPRRD